MARSSSASIGVSSNGSWDSHKRSAWPPSWRSEVWSSPSRCLRIGHDVGESAAEVRGQSHTGYSESPRDPSSSSMADGARWHELRLGARGGVTLRRLGAWKSRSSPPAHWRAHSRPSASTRASPSAGAFPKHQPGPRSRSGTRDTTPHHRSPAHVSSRSTPFFSFTEEPTCCGLLAHCDLLGS
jgi:hypothetical protein